MEFVFWLNNRRTVTVLIVLQDHHVICVKITTIITVIISMDAFVRLDSLSSQISNAILEPVNTMMLPAATAVIVN